MKRGLAALGGLALFAAAAAFGLKVGATRMASGHAGRILLVGLDGADWQIAGPLMSSGRMPHLTALRDRGAHGSLRSLVPVLSPLLWTSVATGLRADQHGILDFLVTDPATGRRLPVSSRARRQRALWNYFDEAGRRSDVVAWWATWPAEPINGHVVSDRVAYSLFDVPSPERDAGLTHPPGLLASIRAEQATAESIPYEEVARFADVTREEFDAARAREAADRKAGWRDPLNHLIRILAATRTYHAAAIDLLRSGEADFTAVYYQGIDEVSHRFMHFAPPRLAGIAPEDVRRFGRVVERFYEYQDALLGELVVAAGPAASILVLSDHGFVNGSDRVVGLTADIEGQPVRWHRLHGILVAAGGPFRKGEIAGATLLDIAPMVLAASGMPVPAGMPGRVIEEAFKPEFLKRHPPRREPAGSLPPFRSLVAGLPDDAGVSEEMLENLRSLGYIGEAAPAPPLPEESGPGAAGSADPAADAAPADVTARVNLAGVLLSAGDLAAARTEIDAALALSPRYRPARYLRFELLARERRLDEAIALGRQLAGESGAGNGPFLARLGPLFVTAGRLEDGIAWMRSQAAAGHAEFEGPLARLLREHGEIEAAESAARRALSRDPASEAALAVLVVNAQSRGSLAPLQPELRDALRANPRAVMPLNWAALVAAERGDLAGGSRLLEQALETNPDHPATLANMGAFLLRQDRQAEAVPLLERALRYHPASREIRVNLATALARQGRLAEAVRHFEAAAEAASANGGRGDPALFNALARAHGEMGDLAAAAGWLRRSLAAEPDQPAIRALLEQVESKQTRPSPR